MAYEWDPAKAASNLVTHGVAFEAIDGFDWATALVLADVRVAYPEPRLAALGAIGDRLHFVMFTVERRSVRIISLRRANRKEVRAYASEGQDAHRGGGMPHRGRHCGGPGHVRALGCRACGDAAGSDCLAALNLCRTGRAAPWPRAGQRPAKVLVTVRVDQDVAAGLRASGPGWQVRANAALRRLVEGS